MIWRILKTNFLTVIVVVSFLAAGCGYHFSPGGEHIDKRLKTVLLIIFPTIPVRQILKTISGTHLLISLEKEADSSW